MAPEEVVSYMQPSLGAQKSLAQLSYVHQHTPKGRY